MSIQPSPEQTSDKSTLWAGSILSAVSATFFLLLPLAIGSVAGETDYEESYLGFLATSYLLAFTAAGVVIALSPSSLNQKLVTSVGFILLALGFWSTGLSLHAPQYLTAAFALSGIGAGILYSVGFRIINLAKNLQSAYGIKLFAEQIVAAALFFYLSLSGFAFEALMKFLAVFVFLCAASILITPRNTQKKDQNDSVVSRWPSKRILLSILCIAAFMFSMTGAWAFLETLSIERSVSTELFSTLGAIGLLLGAVGGFVAAIQGNRLGSTKPLFLAALFVVFIYLFLIVAGFNGFVVFFLAFPFIWNYALAYQLSVSAENDKSNSFAAWLAPAIAIGASGGPLLAGVILELSSGYALMLAITGAMSAIALLASATTVEKSS